MSYDSPDGCMPETDAHRNESSKKTPTNVAGLSNDKVIQKPMPIGTQVAPSVKD